MLRILLFSPRSPSRVMSSVSSMLRQTEHLVAAPLLEGAAENAVKALETAFGGPLPDLVVADLTTSPDLLPLQHLHRVFRTLFASRNEVSEAPATLALITPRHLQMREWHTLLDDFLLPPYPLQETLPRLELMARRKKMAHAHLKKIADLTLDSTAAQVLTPAGDSLPLTPREYALLLFLATYRGRLFSRNRLLDLVWGMNYEGGERTVDIHIRRLRAKLSPQAALLLETRRGSGYCLKNED